MVESTAVSCIHPDKYNNSVNRIISKEEEREDPRRDSSIYLRIQNTVVFPQIIHSTRTTVFPHAIQQLQDISTYRINSSTRTTTTRLIPCHPVQIITRHLPVTAPCASEHSTRQNKVLQASRYSFPCAVPHVQFPVLPVILPGRNSILSGSQHPRTPYSSSQVRPTTQGSTWYYRILPGEIGFTPKGSSIVYPCNTKVSVFQFTYSYT